MSDIEALTSRIMAAMDRVAAGIDNMDAGDAAEADALRAALDEEKDVNAQLTERVRVLGERQEQAMAAMEAKATEAQARMDKIDTELQQYRKAHDMLSEACEALRSANAEGVGDPDAINAALAAELEALRAMRKAEMAEADEILAGLMPLLTAASQPQQSEETS